MNRHVLTTTYFHWDGDFYKQTVHSSLWSPIFTWRSSSSWQSHLRLKLKWWFHYVDDTFVIYSHMEEEVGYSWPTVFTHEFSSQWRKQWMIRRRCLDICKADGSLGHTLCKKPTYSCISHLMTTQGKSRHTYDEDVA